MNQLKLTFNYFIRRPVGEEDPEEDEGHADDAVGVVELVAAEVIARQRSRAKLN